VEVQSQKFVTLSSIKRKRTHQIRDILDRVGVKLTQLFGCDVPKGLEIDLNVPHAVQGRAAPERLKPVVEPKRPRNARKNLSYEEVQAKRQRFCPVSQPADRYVTDSDDEVPVSHSARRRSCRPGREKDKLKAVDDVKNPLIAVQERQVVAHRACFAALLQ